MRAVRQAAPAARLIVDAHESWNERQLGEYMPMLIDLRIALIEQPLPTDADDALVPSLASLRRWSVYSRRSAHSTAR
jgi:L-alanine-DL-glutamate epimerase-like enolase superfamily enzyme